MERILYQISQVLGAAIIHSLWQGLFVYFALRILLAIPLKSSIKYILSFAGLTVIAGWFIYTIFDEVTIYNHAVVQSGNASALPLMLTLPAGIHHLDAEATRYYYSVAQYMPYLSAVYLLGFLYNSTALIVARRRIELLRKNAQIHAALQCKAERFASLMGIGKQIAVKVSQLVDVPCVVGFIKPVVLLPITLSTTLSAEETEAILLHELAHIRRYDYLAYLVQQSTRVLLFFNPFAHLTMSIINRERENSCDDIVVTISKSPLVYAQALVKLEESRRNQWQLALSATGKKYHLLNRIERIMKPKKTTTSVGQIVFTVVMFTIGIACIVFMNPTIANGKISIRNPKHLIQKAAAVMLPVADTTQKKKKSPSKNSQQVLALVNAKSDTTDPYRNDPITNGYQLLGFDDPKQDAILGMLKKYSDAVSAANKTDEYKRLHDNLETAQKNLKNYRNDVLYDQLYSEFRKFSNTFIAKWGGDDGRNEQLGDEIKLLGNKVGNYYGSDEFKKVNERLQKKYNIDPGKKYAEGDKNYNDYRAELSTKLPAEITNSIEQIKKDGMIMNQQMNSLEYKADGKRLTKLVDSLNHFRSSETEKKYQQAVNDAAEQYFAYTKLHEAEEKRNLDSLKLYGEKLHAYNQSAEYRNNVKAWRDQMKAALGDDYEKIEHPDRPRDTMSKDNK